MASEVIEYFNVTTEIFKFTVTQSIVNTTLEVIDFTNSDNTSDILDNTNYENIPVTDNAIYNSSDLTNTTEQNESVKSYRVTYSNLEYSILITYLIAALIWPLYGNLRIFYLIVKKEAYHVPYFYIIASYTLADVIQTLSTAPLMIVGVLLNENYNQISPWFCTIFGILSPAMVFASFHILGLMAIERYYFFVQPLKYPLKFTAKLTFVVIIIIWTAAILFSISIEVLAPRQFYVTIIHCQTPSAKIFTFLQIVFYLSPAFLCTAFSLIKLWILQTSHQARVQDASTANSSAFQRSAKKFKKSKGAAIKIIVLTSGTFWLTFLPNGVFRMLVFSQGVTWQNLDGFDNPVLTYTFRYLNLFLFSLSSALNPLIYLYTHKPLLKQFFNKSRTNMVADTSEDSKANN